MIVIFHSSDGQNHCDDGFASAWVLRQKYGDEIEAFIPGVYGQEPPIEQCRGKPVTVADFSYKREPMKRLIEVAQWVRVFDHHKTARDELTGLDEEIRDGAAEIFFDMARSGASITWDWCFPDVPRPPLIERIEDNDLWRTPRRYEDSLVVQAALRSYPQDFETWSHLMQRPIDDLVHEGRAIRRFIEAKVAELKRTAWIAEIGGVEMPVCNAPWFLASELAGHLAEENPSGRAATYFDQGKRRVFSLRGRKGVDVSEIAKKFGGGGHPGAAGFEVPKP